LKRPRRTMKKKRRKRRKLKISQMLNKARIKFFCLSYMRNAAAMTL